MSYQQQYKYSNDSYYQPPVSDEEHYKESNRAGDNSSKYDQAQQGFNFRSSQNVLNQFPDEDAPEKISHEQFNYADEEGKLRRQIMEKDKTIYEYTRLLKETERNLENVKKQSAAKDEAVTKLKDENKEFRFKIKNYEQHLERKEEELRKFRATAEEKIILLSKEKNYSEEKFNENVRNLEQVQIEQQNYIFENAKLEKQIHKLTNVIEDKTAQIVNLEKLVEELKKETKQIPSLKKQMIEYENANKELKTELRAELEKNETLLNDKNEIDNKLTILIEKSSGENSVERLRHGMMKYSYELEAKNNLIEEKESELAALDEKYKLLSRDNDTFVTMINSEVGDLMLLYENLQYNKGNQLTKASFNSQKFSNNKNSQLGFKYELITKNIEIFRNKIIETHQTTTGNLFKLEKTIKETERNLKETIEERDALVKECSLRQNNLTEIREKHTSLVSENDKLKDMYAGLKENHFKLKNEFEDLLKKYEIISADIQEFLKRCYDKLKDKVTVNFNKKQNSQENHSHKEATKLTKIEEEILSYLDSLLQEHQQLSKKEKDLTDKCKLFQMQINANEDDKANLKKRYNDLQVSKDNELKRLEENKNEEIKLHRENLYEKISTLTNLLETSNRIINENEQEKNDLLNKIDKLEYNLQMMTKSHIELENSLSNNFNCLNSDVEEREYKINNLLREIELKEMHIISVENTLKRKEEEIDKLRNTQKLLYSYSYAEEGTDAGNNYEKKRMKSGDFSSEYNTKEFKFGSGSFGGENNNYIQDIGHSYVSANSTSENKIPGKIFKKKK